MTFVFLKLLNLSLTAIPLVVAALIFRAAFRRAPKWTRCLMWGLVGLRLIIPFTFESPAGFITDPEPVKISAASGQQDDPTPARTDPVRGEVSAIAGAPGGQIGEQSPQQPAAQPAVTSTQPATDTPELSSPVPVSPQGGGKAEIPLTDTASAKDETVPGGGPGFLQIAAFVWAAGAAGMAGYAAFSFLRLRRTVSAGEKRGDGVTVSGKVETPFILGVFRPRIYLPRGLSEEDEKYVIAHERAHLSRGDNLWKPLGFLLLSVYWFNPALWAAYILLCRDIELACDERVIRAMGEEAKASYSRALIGCSMPRRSIAACPLAFGELSVKSRVKNVLNYKKPAFWVIIAAFAVCTAAAICLATVRKSDNDPPAYDGSVYLPVLEKYGALTKDYLSGAEYEELEEKYASDDETSKLLWTMQAYGYPHGGDSSGFGYAERDLDGDGTPELFLIDHSGRLLALFGIRDGSPVLLENYWNRYAGFAGEDGKIYALGSDGTAGTVYEVKSLDEGELVTESLVEEVCGRDGKTTYYRLTDPGDDSRSALSDGEAAAFFENFPDSDEYNLVRGGLKFRTVDDYIYDPVYIASLVYSFSSTKAELLVPSNTLFKISGKTVTVKDFSGKNEAAFEAPCVIPEDDGYVELSGVGTFEFKYSRSFASEGILYSLYFAKNGEVCLFVRNEEDGGRDPDELKKEGKYSLYTTMPVTERQYNESGVPTGVDEGLDHAAVPLSPIDYDTFPAGRDDWELVWEDDEYYYYYPTAEYGETFVDFSFGSTLPMREALSEGLIDFSFLDKYDIPFIVKDKNGGGAYESRTGWHDSPRYLMRYVNQDKVIGGVKTLSLLDEHENYRPFESAVTVTPLEDTVELVEYEYGEIRAKLDFLLSVEGVGEKRFSQTVYAHLDGTDPYTDPEIYVDDLSGDGRPEVVLDFTVTRGSRINEREVRIFDGATLSEYEVEDLSETLSHLIPQRTEGDDPDTLRLTADNAEVSAKKSLFRDSWTVGDEFILDQSYGHSAELGRLTLRSTVYGSGYEDLGVVYVNYRLDGNRFVYDCSSFETYLYTENYLLDRAATNMWIDPEYVSDGRTFSFLGFGDGEKYAYYSPVPADSIFIRHRMGGAESFGYSQTGQYAPETEDVAEFLRSESQLIRLDRESGVYTLFSGSLAAEVTPDSNGETLVIGDEDYETVASLARGYALALWDLEFDADSVVPLDALLHYFDLVMLCPDPADEWKPAPEYEKYLDPESIDVFSVSIPTDEMLEILGKKFKVKIDSSNSEFFNADHSLLTLSPEVRDSLFPAVYRIEKTDGGYTVYMSLGYSDDGGQIKYDGKIRLGVQNVNSEYEFTFCKKIAPEDDAAKIDETLTLPELDYGPVDGGSIGVTREYDGRPENEPSLYRIAVDGYRSLEVRIRDMGGDCRVEAAELTDDGYPEVIFAVQTSGGTGMRTEEIRVFDGKTLSEIPAEDPAAALEELVTITRTDKDGDPANGFVYEINGKKAATSDELLESFSPSSEAERAEDLERLAEHAPTYGDHREFGVEDGKLVCRVGLGYTAHDTLYYGDFTVAFLYDKNAGFTVDSVEYATDNVQIIIKESAAVIAAREKAARLEAERNSTSGGSQQNPGESDQSTITVEVPDFTRIIAEQNRQWMIDHGFGSYSLTDEWGQQGHMGYDLNGQYGWVGPDSAKWDPYPSIRWDYGSVIGRYTQP